MMTKRDFSTASREEIDVTLNVISGTIPSDMYGVIFINSACGTVNSKGLPFKPNNPDGSENEEYGSPLINGDSLMIRLDLDTTSQVQVKTSILKAPCFYADLATSPEINPGNKWSDLKFMNLGLARISMTLGTRNELNTAITPVKFKSDNESRLMATFDAGRPFEFDPEKLKLITAIGQNKIWHSGLPPFLFQPLTMVLTSAHPMFDPYTEEFFSVNFTKTNAQLMSATHIFDVMEKDGKWFMKELKKLIARLEGKKIEEKVRHTQNFLKTVHLKSPAKNKTVWNKIWNWVKHLWSKFYYSKISNENSVKVLRWKGKKDLEEWVIVNEKGEAIAIDDNMHQLGFSKDYLILCDTTFKFTMDVMINFPYQHDPIIDSFIRLLLSGAMNDFSTMYLVKRSELIEGNKTIKATTVHLPLETVHFSANYQNPNNQVTIHTAHNCSACPAEWLRTYDSLIADPNKKVDVEKVGLIAIGEMDIGKIGRVCVDASTGQLVEPETKFLHLTGEKDGKLDQAHTWAIGLYTYNDMMSADTNVDEIKHIFWQSYGISEERLTHYIYNLYKDPERHRTFSAEEMLTYTKMGAEFVLQCVDTKSLESTDFYTFAKDQYFWSLQFAPKKASTPGVDPGKNGYIITTVITGLPYSSDILTYTAEIWIFDANDLASGPICKLNHPKFSFGFTIHSVWVAEASSVSTPSYKLDVEEDYNFMINKVSEKNNLRQRVQELFDQKVYPNFKSDE